MDFWIEKKHKRPAGPLISSIITPAYKHCIQSLDIHGCLHRPLLWTLQRHRTKHQLTAALTLTVHG